MTVDVLLVWCGLAVIAKFELIILLSAIIISLNKLRNQTTRMDLFIIFFLFLSLLLVFPIFIHRLFGLKVLGISCFLLFSFL